MGLKDKKSISKKLIRLLTEREKQSAFAVGIGLRFLYTFSAGNPKNLEMVNLNIKNKKLICMLKPKGKILFDTNSERRLKAFANACKLNYKIIDKNI